MLCSGLTFLLGPPVFGLFSFGEPQVVDKEKRPSKQPGRLSDLTLAELVVSPLREATLTVSNCAPKQFCGRMNKRTAQSPSRTDVHRNYCSEIQ